MKKLLLKSTTLARPMLAISALALLASTGTVFAQEAYNWSGVYVGASVGAVETYSSGDVEYGYGEYAGWSDVDGYFAGEIYNDIDNSSISTYYDEIEFQGGDTAYLDLDSLDSWITEFDLSDMTWTGTGFAGVQAQFGALVLGGEFRATMGSFETTEQWAWADGDSDSDSAGCGSLSSCGVDTDISLSGDWYGYDYMDGDTIDDQDSVWIGGELDQFNAIGFATEFDSSFAAVARAGIAADRFLIYGMAGAAVARVSAATYAEVNEDGEISGGYNSFDPDLHYDGEENYYWYGENTEDKIGYVVGLGLEYAMTDNIILRGEASYTDYGTVSVTGVSEDTDATYTVSQQLTQLQVQTGVMLKF